MTNEPIGSNLGIGLGYQRGYVQPTAPSLPPPQPVVVRNEEEEVGAEIGLRLISKDDISDDQETQLTEDVAMFVRSLLKEGKKREALSFLREHKDHLTSSMKDMVVNEIRENIKERDIYS